MSRPAVSLPLTLIAAAVLLGAPGAEGQWPQWGGPDRNFTVAAADLATAWPEAGPPRLWSRSLGEGNSAITVDGGTVYTMFRQGSNEHVIALDAATGEPRWEIEWPATLWDGFASDFGSGPHTTPLVHGGNLYTLGIAAELLCLRKSSGEKVWSRDLWKELGAEPSGRGYAASPLVHGDLIIVPAGSKGHGVVAFRAKDGEIAWAATDFQSSFASPIVIEVGGQEQVVVFMARLVAGLDPATGRLLWQHPHRTEYDVNASTPVWNGDGLLFLSSAYDAGSRVLELARKDGETTVEELWFSRRMQVHHTTAVRQGDMVVGSSGDFGPAFLMGVDARSGAIRFRERGFAKANLVATGERLIVLDEDGNLALASVGAAGLEIHARAQVLKTRSWAVPTLVGTTLYLRDQREIAALDLGRNP